MAQQLEERCNSEGRDHNSDIVVLADDAPKQELYGEDETKVDQSQQSGPLYISWWQVLNDTLELELLVYSSIHFCNVLTEMCTARPTRMVGRSPVAIIS